MRRESPGASAQHKMQKAIRREGLTTPREAVCLGSHPSDPREDGRPGSPRARGQPQAGRGDGGRPQITLRTVFNICKTAIRAAKVNRVPGSSKVSEFKCFPFARKESVQGLWQRRPREAWPPAPPARGICAHRGGVSHANTQNFSLKLTTVSTARAGPLIWKRHFATRSAGQPPAPRREPELGPPPVPLISWRPRPG